MTGDYGFYAACLRFMARRTPAETPEIAAMMEDLTGIADGVAAGRGIVVPGARLRSAARALAGVAGVLQRHILPEAVAAGDAAAERRVRWMIDVSMEAFAAITLHAETAKEGTDCRFPLPAPPVT
jgi:hypothetical protein